MGILGCALIYGALQYLRCGASGQDVGRVIMSGLGYMVISEIIPFPHKRAELQRRQRRPTTKVSEFIAGSCEVGSLQCQFAMVPMFPFDATLSCSPAKGSSPCVCSFRVVRSIAP